MLRNIAIALRFSTFSRRNPWIFRNYVMDDRVANSTNLPISEASSPAEEFLSTCRTV